MAVATAGTAAPVRARDSAWAASMKPNAPAVASSTVSVGWSRNPSRVVRANVDSIDSSDHR